MLAVLVEVAHESPDFLGLYQASRLAAQCSRANELHVFRVRVHPAGIVRCRLDSQCPANRDRCQASSV